MLRLVFQYKFRQVFFKDFAAEQLSMAASVAIKNEITQAEVFQQRKLFPTYYRGTCCEGKREGGGLHVHRPGAVPLVPAIMLAVLAAGLQMFYFLLSYRLQESNLRSVQGCISQSFCKVFLNTLQKGFLTNLFTMHPF